MNQNELIEIPAWVRNHPETLLNRKQQEELKKIVGDTVISQVVIINGVDIAKRVIEIIGEDDGINRETSS